MLIDFLPGDNRGLLICNYELALKPEERYGKTVYRLIEANRIEGEGYSVPPRLLTNPACDARSVFSLVGGVSMKRRATDG